MRAFALLLLASGTAQLTAQGSALIDALQTGEVHRALELLEDGAVPSEDESRLEAIRLLAAVPATNAGLHERALRWAAQILPETVAARLADSHRTVAQQVGKQLAGLLIAHTDVLVDGRVSDRGFLGAGVAAQQALRLGGATDSLEMLKLAMHLAPLLLAGERPRDAVSVATAGLAATPTGAQAAALHGYIAHGLLQINRPADALPHAKLLVQSDPGNAQIVLPLARALPASMASDAFALLSPVIKSEPLKQAEAAWTESVSEFYGAVDRLGKRKATSPLIADFTQRMPLPQTWHQVLWGEGYRIYHNPDERPSKIASGKDALILPVPQSHGWHRRERAPEDLLRWNNSAYCMQRGDDGPTLVVYWFGPNLEYWYGDTPVERGVTAKTVRGHSAGAIGRMVFDIVYGEDAKRRQLKFTSRAALPFALRESGQRKTFTLGKTIYDETIFSHGPVAIEVLLRVTEAQLVELEPELRWIYATLGKD